MSLKFSTNLRDYYSPNGTYLRSLQVRTHFFIRPKVSKFIEVLLVLYTHVYSTVRVRVGLWLGYVAHIDTFEGTFVLSYFRKYESTFVSRPIILSYNYFRSSCTFVPSYTFISSVKIYYVYVYNVVYTYVPSKVWWWKIKNRAMPSLFINVSKVRKYLRRYMYTYTYTDGLELSLFVIRSTRTRTTRFTCSPTKEMYDSSTDPLSNNLRVRVRVRSPSGQMNT